MIACDTSSLSALLAGETGKDVMELEAALVSRKLVFPPATLAEILSNPKTLRHARALVSGARILNLEADYWYRVAENRSNLIALGLKARLADALIAQSCIDADVALITRDPDLRHFAAHCGLKLA